MHPRALWGWLATSVLLASGCGSSSHTTDGGASGSCAQVCAAMATCDGGTHFTDCPTTCNRVQGVIDPNYWSGVSNCLACNTDPMCIENVAATVPMSTVQNFLQQLCQWAVMCESGVTVSQCVSLLEQNGTMNGVDDWKTIGLLSNSSQQCLLGCIQHQSCNDISTATSTCDQMCGLTDVLGSSSSCSCSGNSSCSGHGHFMCDSSCNPGCVCDPGYVATGEFECTATCAVTGCGAHGTCSGNFCTCDMGYQLGTDQQCHFIAHFTSLGVGGNGICATRDDGRIECFATSAVGGFDMPPTDTGYVSVCVDAWTGGPLFGCAEKMDGSIDCWGEDANRFMSMFGPGQLALGCGVTTWCVSDPSGMTTCYDGPYPTLTATPPPTGLVQLSVYDSQACGRTASGAVECWGSGYSTGTNPMMLPADVASGTTDVVVADPGGCAITASGSLSCWGSIATSVPTNLGTVDQVTLSSDSVCVRKSDRTVRCWGMNSGTDTTPMAFMGRTVLQVAAAPDATSENICALYDDGTFQCSSVFGPTNTRIVSPALL